MSLRPPRRPKVKGWWPLGRIDLLDRHVEKTCLSWAISVQGSGNRSPRPLLRRWCTAVYECPLDRRRSAPPRALGSRRGGRTLFQVVCWPAREVVVEAKGVREAAQHRMGCGGPKLSCSQPNGVRHETVSGHVADNGLPRRCARRFGDPAVRDNFILTHPVHVVFRKRLFSRPWSHTYLSSVSTRKAWRHLGGALRTSPNVPIGGRPEGP